MVHGSDDRVVPVGGSLRMGERIEGVETVVVEGGGHNLFEEDVGGFGDLVEGILEGGGVLVEEEDRESG